MRLHWPLLIVLGYLPGLMLSAEVTCVIKGEKPFVRVSNSTSDSYEVWWTLEYLDAGAWKQKAIGHTVILPKASIEEEYSTEPGGISWRVMKTQEQKAGAPVPGPLPPNAPFPLGPTTGPDEGKIVAFPGDPRGDAVYLVLGGRRVWIPNDQAYQRLFNDSKYGKKVIDPRYAQIPEGGQFSADADLRGYRTDQKLYLYTNNSLHWITNMDVLAKYQFNLGKFNGDLPWANGWPIVRPPIGEDIK